jgi:hypothetical protein
LRVVVQDLKIESSNTRYRLDGANREAAQRGYVRRTMSGADVQRSSSQFQSRGSGTDFRWSNGRG